MDIYPTLQFESHTLRYAMAQGDVWFHLDDINAALGTRHSLWLLAQDERLDDSRFVSPSGVFRLIFHPLSQHSNPFRVWFVNALRQLHKRQIDDAIGAASASDQVPVHPNRGRGALRPTDVASIVSILVNNALRRIENDEATSLALALLSAAEAMANGNEHPRDLIYAG